MLKNLLRFLLIFTPLLSHSQWTVLPFNTGYTNYAVSFINADTGFVSSGIFMGSSPGSRN
jgi:hypothetical protein